MTNTNPSTENETKLDPLYKQRWIEALRNGRYEQGDGALCDKGRYCCLGVLQAVIGKHVIHKHRQGYEYLDFAMPGLSERVQSRLADMNDGRGDQVKCSFPEIADYIEANL